MDLLDDIEKIGQEIDLPFNGEQGRDILCFRDEDGTRHFNVPQVWSHHAPSGMDWGYTGSGPSDFSLNILLAYGLDKATAWHLHNDFKFAYVAGLPEKGGKIPEKEIELFIERHRPKINKHLLERTRSVLE